MPVDEFKPATTATDEVGNTSISSQEFLERSLREVRKRRDLPGVVRRVQWILLAVAVLLIALLLVLVFQVQGGHEETLRRLAVIEGKADKAIFISLEDWESPSFGSGSSDCLPDGPDQKNPCECLYPRSSPAVSTCKQIDEIAAPGKGAAFFVADGGHDRDRLSEALSKSVHSNEELARRRAEAIATVLEKSHGRSGESMLRRASGHAGARLGARGPLELGIPARTDRTVRVTIIRITEQPWKL